MSTFQESTQFLRTKRFALGLAALTCVFWLVAMACVREFGMLGILGAVGFAVLALAGVLHPFIPFTLYFGALFFAETRLPGAPVTANQVLAILFFLSWFCFWIRKKTLTLPRGFWPVLAGASLYFAIRAITGEDFERGSLHFRYVVIYFTLAMCLASTLRSERSVLSLAWIIVSLTLIAAFGGLVEAVQKDAFSALAGHWGDSIRIKGTARNSIAFGWNMVFAFPFAFYLFAELRSRSLRLLSLLCGLFILFIAVLTFNRQTFVAIGILLFLCGLLFSYRDRKLFGAVLGFAALGGSVSVLPKVLARIFTVTQLGVDWSFLERRDQFLLGMEMFAKHPLVGIGLGSFPAVWHRYIPPDYSTYFAQYSGSSMLKFPDFGYMALLAETGIVGLGLFLTLLVVILWRGWKCRRAALERNDVFAYNYASLVLSLALFLTMTSAIQDTFLYVRTWIIYALALLLDTRVFGEAPEPVKEDEA